GLDDGEKAAGFEIVFVLGLGIDVAIELIEFSGHFASQFEMWQLVFADGDVYGPEGEDVGGLADGIEGEAERKILAQLLIANFIFQGWIAHDAVEGDEHGEEKRQLVDGRNFRLDEHLALVRIDAAGEVVGGDFEDRLTDFIWLG